MPQGITTTGALTDSLPDIINEARIVREYEGVITQLCDKHTLGKGEGVNWNEVSLSALTAQAITESTVLDNPQQMEDTLLTITPTQTGVQTIITDRTANRISKNAFGKLGTLAGNAMSRKKNADGLTQVDSTSNTVGAAGSALTSGHIAAAVSNIEGNTTEGAIGMISCVLHPFQIKDLYDELVAGVGTAILTEGPTARVFQRGFDLPVANCKVYGDGNITIDSGDDAKGGVLAKEGLILVQGRALKVETRRRPEIGGGATELFMYDEYAFGFRSSGRWVYEVETDATAPTS